ncbi:heterokaryon incompatibility protein het-E-1 [Fusarium tjaetaba]|uniref:Heterokaryon incompatibility protein het-E-1 n=1 Tax=Fusarium tjaetaba TaxID=1567544 RepID=A0A8H5VA02_9HYPO|nr:heterokaryon incompatibility protein het-E-1 [Fusarium tjaetaba]KAF5614688.1 heterokaryon incompatibility protein het-E-1 [Fusarium tjaetaba]
MAELAALGVAASVLQVVDYGTRFLTTLYQVRQSKGDFLNSLQNLHKSSSNLRNAQHELRAISLPGTSTDAAILSLAKKSEAIAKEILDSLKRIEENSHGRKRDAVIKTWLIILKEDKLKGLEGRLTEVKADLTFYLSVSLRATARETLENQMQMLQEMRDIRVDIKAIGDASSANEVQAGFGSLAIEYLTGGLHERQKLKSEFIDPLIARIHNSEVKAPPDSSSIQLSPQRRQHLEHIFISRVRYDTIQERELTIKEAHKGTFRWIFNDNKAGTSPIGFKEWLASDGSLYWITGKPGSGKSTLMKYLLQPIDGSSNENRCNEYLQQWAGDQKLTIATFHFWAIGSDIQASKEGLLRTLLVQLFRAHPEIIPLVASSRWESLCLFNEDPRRLSQDELEDMFHHAVKHISSRAKLALFIDGLDEFDGDCNALISLVHECIASPIKVCVSSRPWTEFENAFGDYPRLKMEDLTYDDITKYVVSRFEKNSQFARFQKLHPQFAGDLSHSIADKASGVFLWVTIVVASLLAGMMAGDRVEDIENRLDLLPSEMDDLYGRIIESIDPLYREHAAQLFKLVNACREPSLRLLWYADEVRFLDRTIDEDPNAVPLEDMIGRLDDMRRRIVSRCRGLLEVHENTRPLPLYDHNGVKQPCDPAKPDGGDVVYLHRTFKEFLRRLDTQQKLDSYLITPYDSGLRISVAYASLAKLWMRSKAQTKDGTYPFQIFVILSLDHAGDALPSSRSDVVRLLDHLRENCASLCRFEYKDHRFRDPKGEWQKKLTEIEVSNYCSDPNQEFLCLATVMCAGEYIRAKADRNGLVMIAKRNPRQGHFKLRTLWWIRQGNPERLNVSLLSLVRLTDTRSASVVKLLLDKGAKPNKMIKQIGFRRTAWEELLAGAIAHIERNSKEVDSQVTECVHLMLERGAKVTVGTVETAIKMSKECLVPRYLIWLTINRHQRQAKVRRNASLDIVYAQLKVMKKDREAPFRIT